LSDQDREWVDEEIDFYESTGDSLLDMFEMGNV